MAVRTSFAVRQPVPVVQPHATIDTKSQSRRQQAEGHIDGGALASIAEPPEPPESIQRLREFATQGGDISDLLDPGVVERIGQHAVRQWNIDDGSRTKWKQTAERALKSAAQETGENDDSEESGEGLWENSADIRYPLLTTASQQFAARAGPELVKGDKVVGVKVFEPPARKPSPAQVAQALPPPQSPQQGQVVAMATGAAQKQEQQQEALLAARRARAERVQHYLNFLIFYKMDDWEGETDLLLHQIPITGAAFKKVYMGTTGLCSDYVSALRLTVHNDTKSLYRCPRITHDFDAYPYEIEQKRRAGIYRDIDLPNAGDDPETPRRFIEQERLDDLDGDGLDEPYIVTVDVETMTTMRIEPAYIESDIVVDDPQAPTRVIRIDRWNPYAPYLFLPDPRGKFYGIGFGRLLESITDSVDTSINQLLDAGTAEIAGGGFIGSNVRLQGSGQGGAAWFEPGEYKTVSTPGGDLRQAIWERTVPHPSAVTFQLLELLLAAAKDVASVKDVITGEAPSTAPVGTTLALQQQALQVFSAIYKRFWRGLKAEFNLMYRAIQRWATDKERQEYAELTGGDLDEDFGGDGTDIEPVADPNVVTKMQKIARIQSMLQWAESPVGVAAGMQQPGPAQELTREFLEAIDEDRPDRFFADVPPNPMAVAKAQDMQATAAEREAKAKTLQAKLPGDLHRQAADTAAVHADTLHRIGEVAKSTHELHQEADRVAKQGTVATPEQLATPQPEGSGPNGNGT